jgi:hypothetical protein
MTAFQDRDVAAWDEGAEKQRALEERYLPDAAQQKYRRE